MVKPYGPYLFKKGKDWQYNQFKKRGDTSRSRSDVGSYHSTSEGPTGGQSNFKGSFT